MYDSSATTEPGTTVEEYTEFPDQELVPVAVEEELVANVNIELGVFFDTADDGTNRAFFNNVTYRTVSCYSFMDIRVVSCDKLIRPLFLLLLSFMICIRIANCTDLLDSGLDGK